MSGKEAFGVVVRVTGLWMALYGFYALISGSIMSRLNQSIMVGGGSMTIVFLAYGLLPFVVGIFLLRWPQVVIRFAYPEDRRVD